MIKISHEVPISLLNKSYSFNDYDYCLPVFLDKFPEYRNYFLKAKEDKRFIIMDNSLFEGYIHTESDLDKKIKLIKPDIFITPDVWNDSQSTLDNAKHWINKGINNTNLMIVLQGKSFDEMINLFHKAKSLGYKHFAINHSSIAYQNVKEKHTNHLVNQMFGRFELLSYLHSSIEKTDYIHLLGCSLPQEFLFYKNQHSFIKSIDTSNPIIFGSLGIRYSEYGMTEKPSMKIEEILTKDINNNIDDIMFNINKFKYFVNEI